MADSSVFSDRLLTQQKAMFRQAAVAGFTQDRIHNETGLPTTSLSEWANGKAKLSMVGFLRLAAVEGFPNELLSLLFAGTGRVVLDEEGEEPDFDARATSCIEYLGEHTKARHPGSPGGEKIVAVEKPALVAKLRRAAA